MSRVPTVSVEDLPDSYEYLEKYEEELPEKVSADFWNNTSTVQHFANNPELSEVHIIANTAMWIHTGLSLLETEYVILTVAHGWNAEFVWHHHIDTAMNYTEAKKEEILAISNQNYGDLPNSKSALLKFVHEFATNQGKVSDKSFEKLKQYYDDRTFIGITMLAGFYIHLIHVTTAIDLPLTESFVGWKLQNM